MEEAIRFQNVEKEFQDGQRVIRALKSTSINVFKGEFVAVIGPSGSGKSTFLTLAGGLQTPTNGEVFVNNKPFSKLSEKKRAKKRFEEIGFILQSSNLVPFLRVKKQLELVDKINRENNEDYAEQLFQELGIDQLGRKFPSEISGGERQRVAIARALYNDPSVILADEPTASLDTDRAYEVVKLLQRETKEKNKATIMVTHDTRLIGACDRIFTISDGVLVETK